MIFTHNIKWKPTKKYPSKCYCEKVLQKNHNLKNVPITLKIVLITDLRLLALVYVDELPNQWGNMSICHNCTSHISLFSHFKIWPNIYFLDTNITQCPLTSKVEETWTGRWRRIIRFQIQKVTKEFIRTMTKEETRNQ